MANVKLTKTHVTVAEIEAVIRNMEEREKEFLTPSGIVFPEGAQNSERILAARAAGIRDVLISLRQLIQVTP